MEYQRTTHCVQTFKAVLVGEMGQLAVGAGMASVLPLPSARTPVLKFTIPETGTRVRT